MAGPWQSRGTYTNTTANKPEARAWHGAGVAGGLGAVRGARARQPPPLPLPLRCGACDTDERGEFAAVCWASLSPLLASCTSIFFRLFRFCCYCSFFFPFPALWTCAAVFIIAMGFVFREISFETARCAEEVVKAAVEAAVEVVEAAPWR